MKKTKREEELKMEHDKLRTTEMMEEMKEVRMMTTLTGMSRMKKKS